MCEKPNQRAQNASDKLLCLLIAFETRQILGSGPLYRKVLVRISVRLKLGYRERLYQPRSNLGRELHIVDMRRGCMFIQLKEVLDKKNQRPQEEQKFQSKVKQ